MLKHILQDWRAAVNTDGKAVLWLLLATAMFSIVYASGKLAGPGIPTLQIVFLRYVGGVILLAMIAFLSPQPLRAHLSKTPWSHLGRALAGSLGGVAIIYSSANMPIMDATAISLLSVVFTIGLSALVLGERMNRKHWLGLVLCTGGAALIVISRGAFQTFNASYLFPAMIALIGALLIGLEAILIRTLSQAETPMTMLLHVNVFGLLILSGPAGLVWTHISWSTAFLIMLLGPLAISAQYFVVRGYRIAKIAVVAPIDYTWLIFAALIGFMFFGELPTLAVIAGSVIITIGGIVVSVVPRRKQHP